MELYNQANFSNPDLDEAIRLRPAMEAFLRQDMHEPFDFEGCQTELAAVMSR